MSGPDRIMIFGIPEDLHNALCTMTQDLTDLGQLLGGSQAAYQDCLKSYGLLVSSVANHVKQLEEDRDISTQIEAALADVGSAGTRGSAKGAEGGEALAADAAHPTEAQPRGSLGLGDAGSLHQTGESPDGQDSTPNDR